MLRVPNLEVRVEVLATLGEALCLGRRRVTASGTAGGRFDVAAYEMDHIVLSEVDERGHLRWSEVFASDHLGEAIKRLYQRYAELLPEGPERDRAAATAVIRARAGLPATHDPEGFAAGLAPDFEGVDHRRLGSWSMRGAEAYLEHLRALHQVGDAITIRPFDVLALEPEATLCRTMHTGIERLGRGAYERPFLVIWATGADGRLVRGEWFDDDRVTEAIDHRWHATYGRDGVVETLRRMMQPGGAALRSESVATLGEAVVRLYELYAAQCPEGPERTRAAAIAGSIAAYDGPIDPDRINAATAPASRNVDHRVFGTWTTSNAADILRHYRHQLELAPDFAARFDDVLALAPDVLLARMSVFGTAHESGGAFENRVLLLFTFGADGRVGDTETFEAEQGNEAIRDSNRPGPRAWNRADAFRDPLEDAWHARDWPAMERLLHEDFRCSDRRPLILLDLDRDGWIDMTRQFADMDSARLSVETVATRGERLVLWRVRSEVAGGDVGESLIEHLNLFETNEEGDRLVWSSRFEVTDVAAAYAELDARYEAEQGEFLPASWTVLRRWIRAVADQDWEAVASLCRARHPRSVDCS